MSSGQFLDVVLKGLVILVIIGVLTGILQCHVTSVVTLAK